jgi:hypothetical protein
MSISDTTENALLALIFCATAWGNYADNAATTPQTNIHVALSTADPGDAGTMSTSEATYTSYARVNVARTTGGWTVSGTAPTQVAPVATIAFPAGTGGSGTVTNFATGKTGGGATAILFSGTVTPNIVTGNGVTPQLSTSTTMTLD